MFKKGNIPWNKGLKGVKTNNKGVLVWNKGIRNPVAHLHFGKHAKKGNVPWNKGTKGIMKSNITSFKKGKSGFIGRHKEKTKRKISMSLRGIKRWDRFTHTERQRIMASNDYILWRTAVFIRDNYACQICKKRGGKLEADHIKPFALYPELRFAIDNGRTLCRNCHRKTDTWGFKGIPRDERRRFLRVA